MRIQTSIIHLYRLAVVLPLAGAANLSSSPVTAATLRPATVKAWQTYVRLTEVRITQEVTSPQGFLVRDFLPTEEAAACRHKIYSGEICVVKMKTLGETGRPVRIPSGMVHHWLGTVFVPGFDLDEVLSWVQKYSDHEHYFDEVADSKLLSREGDQFKILLRLKRKKVVTVHYNTEHQVDYRYRDRRKVYCKSFTTKITQLENAGTPEEREKPEGRDSGFLWRLNSYWRYQQVAGGVIIECESVSLSRGVPAPLRWLVGRYINSMPKESMEATLSSIRRGVAQPPRRIGLCLHPK